MKNPFANLSLAKKLTLLTGGITLFTTAAILFVVYLSFLHLNKNLLNDELEAHKTIIAQAYVEPLWSFDKDQIQKVSETFFSYTGFISIVSLKVVDSKGVVLFDKNHISDQKLTLNQLQQMPFTNVAEGPVIKDGQELGRIYVSFTTKGFVAKLRSELGSIFTVSFLLLVAASVWFLFFFDKMLTAPFNKLLDHIKQIRNQDYETKEYSPLPYEMRLISNALNFNSHLIRKRNEELKMQTENLEKIVIERTDELKNQIVKNTNASRLVAVGEVASGIAHEINNPLTVINGQISRIKKQIIAKQSEEELLSSVEKIQKMSDRIVKIIKGLKLISRDGHADPLEEFSISELVEEVKLLTEMKIKSMNIDFQVIINHDISNAIGREVQISQVIVNLINNAVDAITNLDEKWITIEVNDFGEKIQFSITDSGKGIPLEVREKIMQPFFTTKEVGKGTGLGLSISKGIIIEHGGQFYYNELSINTQFVFTINKAHSLSQAA